MAMILDAFISRYCTLLIDFIHGEMKTLLGVKGELQKLQQQMVSIQCLLKDAEKKKFDDSTIDLWLSQIKDVMYEAEDIIDRGRIEGTKLLSNQTSNSQTSPVCSSFLSNLSSCFTSVPERHEIAEKIKILNDRLDEIYKHRKKYKLEKSMKSKDPQTTSVDPRQTSSVADPLVVGGEIEDVANRLVDRLVMEKVEEKCRIFAVAGMGGIGKTTLAQRIFNDPKIHTYFNLNVWVCVSQTYSETELLKQLIRGAKGSYGDANTKSELQAILRDVVASGQSLFLVLDDVWRTDVWVDLLRVPLYAAKSSVRVLVTTRDENVARDMKSVYIHQVMKLSIDSSWDMLRRLLFSDEEEQQMHELKELGVKIVERCGGLPLAIKAIAGVLARKDRSQKEWDKILRNDAWSIGKLPEELRGSLYLSFEDLPSHLKQCFLYLSLFPEDAKLFRDHLTQFWVAEGFVTERKGSLMEDLAEECFNELIWRNLLLPYPVEFPWKQCKVHDVVRSLALWLSEKEASCGDVNVKSSFTTAKLRRLSVVDRTKATEILDSVANPEALRTLLASNSDLLLDDARLKRFSFLRVLDISLTWIEKLPDSIEKLVYLRYLDVSCTNITEIPESIKHLAFLQFLNIRYCTKLRQLPNGITQLYSLRCLALDETPISFIPKGITNMKHLNVLIGFVEANNDSSSSKLEDLSSLKHLRRLEIRLSKRVHQSGANFLKELSSLAYLAMKFSQEHSDSNMEEQPEVEKLFDELIPPRSLEEFIIYDFFGHRYPKWMALSSFENNVPNLAKLVLYSMPSCTQLPPLGQLPNLKEITISHALKVKKIGPEFLGGGVNSTTMIAFPKLETLSFSGMAELQDWTFGAQVEEENASPTFKLMPCLHKLEIMDCPLLKQLPKGLKHSALKSLFIHSAYTLKSLDDLPAGIEELEIAHNKNLERICSLPALKVLRVDSCQALSFVEKLDALQEMVYNDPRKKSLPEWLLMLLRDVTNGSFSLQLWCSEEVLQTCVKGGDRWDIIERIPRVTARGRDLSYLRYSKQPFVYDTNL